MNNAKMRKYIIDGYGGRYNIPEIRKYYDYSEFMNFGYWDKHTLNQKQACENLMKKLLAFIPNKTGTILDVACGRGESTFYLLKHYAPKNVTGIDISYRELNIARRKAPGCCFILMSATELGFPAEFFDNVICVEASFHFFTREDFFLEAYRVLKPGGYLVVSDVLMTQEAERAREDRTEKNFVKDLAEYKAILQRTGFGEVVVVDATEHSWKRHFWNLVTCLHQKFLNKEITRDELQSYLDRTYRRARDIEWYPLAAAKKP